MNSQEKKKLINERKKALEGMFENKYGRAFNVQEQKCFKARDDEFFLITRVDWANAIVLEHAFSEEEAQKNLFEDGDLFGMGMDLEQMYGAMIKEIED